MPANIRRFLQSSAASLGFGLLCWASLQAVAQAESPRRDSSPPEAVAGNPSQTATDAPWRGTVELYAPLPFRLDTTTTIDGRRTETVFDLGEVLEKLEWTSSLRASMEQGRWGLLTDLSYTQLGQEEARSSSGALLGRPLTGRATIAARQGIYDLALRYRFGEPEAAIGKSGTFSLIPYAGLRVIDAHLDVEAEISGPRNTFEGQGSFGRTWAQPLLGAQASVFLSRRWRAFARADIGGFGMSGSRDLSGNAQLGLGYAIGNNTDLNVSWRYFGIDFNNGENPDSGYSSYQNGLEIGVKFFF